MDDALQPGEAQLLMSGRLPRAEALEDVNALYAAHQPRIFRYLLFSLHDRDAAASLTQDTFLKAWQTRASFRGDCAEGTWLMRIAVNLLRDHMRLRSLRFWRKTEAQSRDAEALAEVLPCPGCSAEQMLLAREEVAQMWRAVEALSDRQRSVFLLRYVEEMELGEIVAVTGMTLPTVKTHLYRALALVRSTVRNERRHP